MERRSGTALAAGWSARSVGRKRPARNAVSAAPLIETRFEDFKMPATLSVFLALALSILTSNGNSLGGGPELGVELVADGLTAPVDLTFAPDDSERRFIVDQNGLVLILTQSDEILSEPFLDIRDRVVIQSAFDERGLLSLAFHPEFSKNRKLYLHYSAVRKGPNICVDAQGRIPAEPDGCPFQHTRRISEFRVSPSNANRVDPDSERVIFAKQWPGRKHNGGGLAFGPDHFLHIGLGDGGFIHGPDGAGSPFDVDPDLLFGDELAQDPSTLFGKILRVDVDRDDFPHDPERNYGIPEDNPFVGQAGMPSEIFAWGFRNPFRISFDRGGDRAMYVSAPAETFFEAVYKVDWPGNFGWAAKEGTHCIVRASALAPPETIACDSSQECPVGPQVSFCQHGVCDCEDLGPAGFPIQDPVVEYLNFAVEQPDSQLPGDGFGRASVGGHIYRGSEIPWLTGQLVAGDFAINTFDGQVLVAQPRNKKLWRLRRGFVFDPEDPAQAGFMKAIGIDAAGELYAITGNFTPTGLQGRVWKIVAGRASPE